MIRYIFFLLIILPIGSVKAQNASITQEHSKQLDAWQDSILVHSDSLINALSENDRTSASYKMIKTLVKALKVPGSYYYPFEQLNSVSILKSPDESFRIFTWQLELDNRTHRYFGAIQMKSDSLKLFPLVDYSQFYQHPDSVIVDADRWMGALYYQMIPVKAGKKTYYTLLGWNAGNAVYNRKYIEVLWFDDNGKPKFGYPLFEIGKAKSPSRVIFDYKKDASFSLNKEMEKDLIYYDHLVSLSGAEDAVAFDKVPDGTQEAFEWKKGKWKHISIVEYDKLKDGEAPNVSDKQNQPLYQPLPPR